MSRDIFDDRDGFAAARHAFVTKQRAVPTPGPDRKSMSARSAAPRPASADPRPRL